MLMKKLITLLLVLTGMVLTASPTGKTIKFKPNSNWTQASAKFAIWQSGHASESDAWTTFSATADANGYYTATLQEGYTKMNFVRYGGDVPNWDWSGNQSQDIVAPAGATTYYKQINDDWGYNVVGGDYYLCVSTNSNAWTDASHYLMADQGDRSFKTTIDNQTTTNCLYFMIVPSSAINDWGSSPYNYGFCIYADTDNHSGENPWIVLWQNMEDNVGYGYWSRWKIDNIPAKFDFTFDEEDMSFELSPYYTRSVTSASEGYATFGYAYDTHVETMPDGAEVKYASNITDGSITWTAFTNNDIPAYAGALLKGVGAYKFVPSASALSSLDENTDYLRGQIENAQKKYDQYDGRTLYVLTKVDDNIGFYKAAADPGSWLNPNTAYLNVPNGKIPSARDFFALDDETTGIEAVKAEQKLNGEYFNLAGQRVAQPTKGMYIVNGKKVVIK